MRYIVIIASVVILIGGFACREKGIEPHPSAIYLTAEDVGVTDAWLRLTVMSTTENDSIVLVRDGYLIYNAKLKMQNAKVDTLILDENLLLNKAYTYQAFRYWGELQVDRTADLKITTMDTTSHNFTWQIDTLGDGNSSVLYDVAILSDTLAYAVGEINVKDSLGNWQRPPYNIACWDGQRWKLQTVNFTWDFGSGYSEAVTIFAFDAQNIVMSSGGSVMHWNGQVWRNLGYLCQGTNCIGNVYKIWGRSVNDFYGVGRNGSVVHWDGSSWRRLVSGTNMSLTDIYGSPDTIVMAGIDPTLMKGIILSKSGSNLQTIAEGDLITANEIFKPKLYGFLTSVWIDENNTIYAGGNLFYKYQFSKWNYVKSLPENYIGGNPNVYYRGFIYKIRGRKSNDLWIVGDRNTIRHFNGISWQQIGLPYDPTSDIIWRSIDVKNNLCVAVGDGWNKAICIRIKR